MKKIYLFGAVILILVLGFVANAQGGKFFKFLDNLTVYKAYSTPEEFLADGGDWDEIQLFDEPKFGSVSVTSEYNATTTLGTNFGAFPVLKGGWGALGSIVVTKAGTAGSWAYLYDATTTNATLRTNTATTTLAVWPTDLVAGTYTFDVNFNYGLLMGFSNSMGTTTITFR